MAFTVAVEHLDGTIVVCPVGELDLATAPELERVLSGLRGDAHAVLLDLSGLTFVDCAGLGPIRETVRQEALLGRQVRLSAARPLVQRVLELTGLQELVTS